MKFMYEGLNNYISICELEEYNVEDKIIFIATELEDNPGASITNSAEYLIKAIHNKFNLKYNDFVLIEHYIWPNDEHYDYVNYTILPEDEIIVSWQRLNSDFDNSIKKLKELI